MERFEVSAIGRVAVDEEGFALRLDAPWRAGLAGLAGFSHVTAVWWAHRVDEPGRRRVVELERPYAKGPAKLGVFATHSPARPNPICATTVPILRVDEQAGLLRIPWIDAEDGTPLLDLKAYHRSERVRETQVPEWCRHWPAWWEDAGAFDWAAEVARGA
jgi:tRNA (Thr-GGU) A37 N-methylase